MKTSLIAILLAVVFVACDSPQDKEETTDKNYFEITFGIDQEKNEEATLTFEIALDSGYYFLSPHTEGLGQRLLFSVLDTDNLLLDGELEEYPKPREEFDELTGKQGKFVRKNTTYNQNLIVNSSDDFEVSGLIWLEILPVYQPYQVSFVISHKSGELEIEEISTSVTGYPTFWDKKRIDIPIDKSKKSN
ncbi:MAG: hypothetical protein HUJ25_14710 [Crocinitomicaceae bacterium]|nr:hypothetical protein [Crocinitomicaceae bacterium]